MSSFCICKNYSHFFSKNTCELDIVLTRTVYILITNKLIKLTALWTTGPRQCKLHYSEVQGDFLQTHTALALAVVKIKECPLRANDTHTKMKVMSNVPQPNYSLSRWLDISAAILQRKLTVADRKLSSQYLIVPHLFEEKRRDTVFGFPWCVVPNV